MSVSESTTTDEQSGEVVTTILSLDECTEATNTKEMTVVGTGAHSHSIVD